MVKCEWIHPDRVRFIPESRIKQIKKQPGPSQVPVNRFRLEREREDYIVYSTSVK
jgi:hypothetical protein